MAQPGGFRTAYTTHGVSSYYLAHGSTYRNPHFPGVVKCIHALLDTLSPRLRARYAQNCASAAAGGKGKGKLVVFDLAAGSGEATIAVRSWVRRTWGELLVPDGDGGDNNENCASTSTTTAAAAAAKAASIQTSISSTTIPTESLPMGNEDSPPQKQPTFLLRHPASTPLTIHASDPFTAQLYTDTVNAPPPPPPSPNSPNLPSPSPPTTSPYPHLTCHPFSFRDIITSTLPTLLSLPPQQPSPILPPINLTLISFALHLVPPTELYSLLYELSLHCEYLLVIAPHKKPEIPVGGEWGWVRVPKLAEVKEGGGGGGEEEDGVEELELELGVEK
ncbi:hypothetical protein DFH27DRAFT_651012 [Peziza echinospora]|nr:hypothetical protein DFH27DRAFT_651012 [Peziza echinospora]